MPTTYSLDAWTRNERAIGQTHWRALLRAGGVTVNYFPTGRPEAVSFEGDPVYVNGYQVSETSDVFNGEPPFYLEAVIGRRQTQLDQPDGGWISTVDRDMLFHWNDLDEIGIRPALHDRIEYVQNLRPLLWEGEPVLWEGVHVIRGQAVLIDVAMFGPDRQYDFSDQYRQIVRVHGTELSRTTVDLSSTYPVCTVLWQEEPVLRSGAFVLRKRKSV